MYRIKYARFFFFFFFLKILCQFRRLHVWVGKWMFCVCIYVFINSSVSSKLLFISLLWTGVRHTCAHSRAGTHTCTCCLSWLPCLVLSCLASPFLLHYKQSVHTRTSTYIQRAGRAASVATCTHTLACTNVACVALPRAGCACR